MMSQQSRRELVLAVAPRYRQAGKVERGQILDEFVANIGYQRKYAISLLNHPTRAVPSSKRKRTNRPRRYDGVVQHALITCWRAANGICSKRLVPYLPELVAVLERHSPRVAQRDKLKERGKKKIASDAASQERSQPKPRPD